MGIIEILMIVALVLFLLAAFGVPTRNISLGWLGAACVTLAWILGGVAL